MERSLKISAPFLAKVAGTLYALMRTVPSNARPPAQDAYPPSHGNDKKNHSDLGVQALTNNPQHIVVWNHPAQKSQFISVNDPNDHGHCRCVERNTAEKRK